MKFKKLLSCAAAAAMLGTAALAVPAGAEGETTAYGVTTTTTVADGVKTVKQTSNRNSHHYIGSVEMTGLTSLTLAVNGVGENGNYNFLIDTAAYSTYTGQELNESGDANGAVLSSFSTESVGYYDYRFGSQKVVENNGTVDFGSDTAIAMNDAHTYDILSNAASMAGEAEVIYLYAWTNAAREMTLTATYAVSEPVVMPDYGVTTAETTDDQGRRVVTMTSVTTENKNHYYIGAIDMTNVEKVEVTTGATEGWTDANIAYDTALASSIEDSGYVGSTYYDSIFNKGETQHEVLNGAANTYDITSDVVTFAGDAATVYVYAWVGSVRTMSVTVTYKAPAHKTGFTFGATCNEIASKTKLIVYYTENGEKKTAATNISNIITTQFSGGSDNTGDVKLAVIITDIPANASVDSMVIE